MLHTPGLWAILTYFVISNICLNPVDASILKIGFVCSSHGHTALFSLHQPCLSFLSLYFQFLFCLRCIFCKQYWVFNPIRDCVFWKRNPPNSHLCGTCHIGLFLPSFWLYVLLFPFYFFLIIAGFLVSREQWYSIFHNLLAVCALAGLSYKQS